MDEPTPMPEGVPQEPPAEVPAPETPLTPVVEVIAPIEAAPVMEPTAPETVEEAASAPPPEPAPTPPAQETPPAAAPEPPTSAEPSGAPDLPQPETEPEPAVISQPPREREAPAPAPAPQPAFDARTLSQKSIAKKREKIQDHLKKILALAQEKKTITNRYVVQHVYISPATANRYLNKLVVRGQLKREGRGRSVVYSV